MKTKVQATIYGKWYCLNHNFVQPYQMFQILWLLCICNSPENKRKRKIKWKTVRPDLVIWEIKSLHLSLEIRACCISLIWKTWILKSYMNCDAYRKTNKWRVGMNTQTEPGRHRFCWYAYSWFLSLWANRFSCGRLQNYLRLPNLFYAFDPHAKKWEASEHVLPLNFHSSFLKIL